LRAAFISERGRNPFSTALPTLPNADRIRLSGDRQLAIDSSQGSDTISRSLPTPEAVMSRPPLPPFTRETAAQKARMAEDAWNSRDPGRVALAYTEDSRWRNRSEFFEGRAAIVAFLTRKWAREHEYRLIKDLWAFDDNRIAVRFQYEWHDDAGQWHRSYGNEQWEFDEHGLMRRREASINDVAIAEADRRFRWAAPGPRPADVPGLGESPF
jgi:uncharacterized protein